MLFIIQKNLSWDKQNLEGWNRCQYFYVLFKRIILLLLVLTFYLLVWLSRFASDGKMGEQCSDQDWPVLLQVKDPRFEWTKDKTLVLRDVTHSDQGVYANKLSHSFTYETVRLIVAGTTDFALMPYIYVFCPKAKSEQNPMCLYFLGTNIIISSTINFI